MGKSKSSFDDMNSCEDIMRCVFDLTLFELEVFFYLSKNGAQKVEDVAEHFGKDRSTAYRALQKMAGCGICERKTLYLEKGGYYHVYEAKATEEVKNMSKKCAQDWYKRITSLIEEIDKMMG